MHLDFITMIVLLSPLAFLATALYSRLQPGLRPQFTKRLSIASSIISMATAAIGGYFVFKNGLMESPFIGFEELGFSIRLDAVSTIMFSMISIIAFIVVKFTLNYLDGDENQGKFIGLLAATIASVQLLVLSGNLAILLISWILTSMSLHKLLVFYKDRAGAFIAAKKKFIVARLGDISLLGAALLLYSQFGTGNLEVIFQEIKMSLGNGDASLKLEFTAILLSLAAILKSAQFPTHGWLIEVMETPTPVSALLHAGLLNAGPFLLIRMAFIMEASTYASYMIIVVGGFTALFTSVAFLTQTSVKTALGYSSVAHMGFSLMVCGMGAFPAAMLHLVAHSFYKAHSFLSSGSVIDTLRSNKVKAAKRTGSPIMIAVGIAMALTIYSVFAIVWGINPIEDLSLLAIGGIIVLGLSTLFTAAFDSNGSLSLMLRASILAVIVAASFFTLESAAHYLLASQLPEVASIAFGKTMLIAVVLISFATVAFIQILSPVLSSKPAFQAIAVHLRNGFYANALFDRLIGALNIHSSPSLSKEDIQMVQPKEYSLKREFEEQTA